MRKCNRCRVLSKYRISEQKQQDKYEKPFPGTYHDSLLFHTFLVDKAPSFQWSSLIFWHDHHVPNRVDAPIRNAIVPEIDFDSVVDIEYRVIFVAIGDRQLSAA
jgi:hypothetical protein